MYFKDTSQSNEMTRLFSYIINHPNKVIVDVGANDGFRYSNSFGLIDIGWEGHLIEANPYNANKAVELHKKNARVKIYNCAASNENGTTKIFFDKEGKDSEALGATIEESLPTKESNWKGINTELGTQINKYRLDNLLGNLKDVAILSVDTEGHDLEVLQGMGAHLNPSFIITEYDFWNFQKALQKQKYLTYLEYLYLTKIGCNEIYINSNCGYIKSISNMINTTFP